MTVSDGTLTDTQDAFVKVTDVNDAPVVPTFAPAVNYQVGFGVSWVSLADTNGNGTLDAILANHSLRAEWTCCKETKTVHFGNPSVTPQALVASQPLSGTSTMTVGLMLSPPIRSAAPPRF